MVCRSKEEILQIVYEEVKIGSPTIYDINDRLGYERICVARKYVRQLVWTGSIQTSFDPERECTVFTIKNG